MNPLVRDDVAGAAEETIYSAVWLGGCTASGKSAIALELAERLEAEIVSVDSMQVYQGLDIGTAKPSLKERRRVPHHLIDVVAIQQPFDVSAFLNEAAKAVALIRQQGKLPLLCGGTGLYFQALLAGIGSGPAPEPTLRKELEATPQETLLDELRCKDPRTFQALDRKNPRRVVRAVEVLRLSGRAAGDHRSQWSKRPAQPAPFFAIERDPADLGRRIDQRVETMFQLGLVEETKELLSLGLDRNRAALQAIGYRQVAEHLAGGRGLEETVALVKQRTRTYARRQRNWFMRRLPTQAVRVEPEERPEQTAERLLRLLPKAEQRKDLATEGAR